MYKCLTDGQSITENCFLLRYFLILNYSQVFTLITLISLIILFTTDSVILTDPSYSSPQYLSVCCVPLYVSVFRLSGALSGPNVDASGPESDKCNLKCSLFKDIEVAVIWIKDDDS